MKRYFLIPFCLTSLSLMTYESVQAYSYNSASQILPYDEQCRSLKSCYACKHSQYECHWCHDYGCTSMPRLFCPKKVYLDIILNRRKLSHCSEIQSETSLVIPAQVSKIIQLNLQVDDLTLYDRPLSCEFNVEGRVTEVPALVKNKTVYCDPVVLNTKRNISNAYVRLVWGGAHPFSNKVLLIVYRCNALAGSCGECRAMPKFDCGWCIDTNQCSASEQCPRQAGPWINRRRTCTNAYYKTNLVTFNYNRLNKIF